MVARRPRGGEFGAPELVGARLSVGDSRLLLELNARGDAVLGWGRKTLDYVSRFPNSIIAAAVMRSGGRFGELHDLAESDGPWIGADVDESGNALVAWRSMERRAAVTAFAGADGRFSAPQLIGDGESVEVAVGFDGQGNALAVWERHYHVGYTLEARIRSADGQWGETATLADNIGILKGIAVEANGRAHIVYEELLDECCHRFRLFRRTRDPRTGSWQPAQMFPLEGDNAYHPVLVESNPSGAVMVTWGELIGEELSTRTRRDRAVVLLPGKPWGEPAVIAGSDTHSVASAAVDRYGNGAVAMGCCPRVQLHENMASSILDATGPVLRDVRIPARAKVRVPVRFSVSSQDIWSARTATRWTFGDGTASRGTSVQHRYRRPGRYTVRVTSTDAVGNVSKLTRRLRIVPR